MSSLLQAFLKVAVLVGVVAIAAPQAVVAADPPNIVIVNIDDISPSWFPPYARKVKPEDIEPKIIKEYAEIHAKEGTLDLAKTIDAACHSTPFVDSLAQNGMVFDRCFATSSLCAPSRSALLTGCYQQRWGSFSIPDVFAVGIPASVPVLVENFKAAGYTCGIVGKWHISEHDPALKGGGGGGKGDKDASGYETSCAPGQSPLDRGFDYYYGYNDSGIKYYESDGLWEGHQRVPKRPPGEFLTDLLNGKCVDFVTQAVSQNKHFLLYYAPMALHGGLMPPPDKYSSQFHTRHAVTDPNAGHLLAVDTGIRMIFDVLKAHGLDQNTLFILSADNGQTYYRVPPYNAPYRGGKGTGWLGGEHEPLIISWPAQLHAGWHSELVSTMDIFPTALDAAGLAPTKPIDGRSLLPLMRGQTKVGPHDELFAAGLHATNWSDSYFEGEMPVAKPPKSKDEMTCPLFAWRQDDSSVLMYISKTNPHIYPELPNGRPQQRLFFNLKDDPKEMNNIFADTPEVEKANAELGAWLQNTKPPLVKHASDYEQLLQMTSSTTPVP
jgi:uncharacterized sulfatase